MRFKSLIVKQTVFMSVFFAGLATSGLAANNFEVFGETSHRTGKYVGCDARYFEGSIKEQHQCLTAMRNAEKALLTLQSSANRTEKLNYFEEIVFVWANYGESGTVSMENGALFLNISLSPQEIIDTIQAVTLDFRRISKLRSSLSDRLNIFVSCHPTESLGLDRKSVEAFGYKFQVPVPVTYQFTFNSCVSALQRFTKALDQDAEFEAWLRDDSYIKSIVLSTENRETDGRNLDRAWIDISHNVSDAALKKQLRDAADPFR